MKKQYIHMGGQNMIVCVTGATSGYGKAILERFVSEGKRVIAIGRRQERLLALQRLYQDAVFPVPLDVCQAESVYKAFAGLPADWSDIQVLVNNAGLALGLGRAPDINLADWHTMIDTNIKALVTVTQAVLPGMVPEPGAYCQYGLHRRPLSLSGR